MMLESKAVPSNNYSLRQSFLYNETVTIGRQELSLSEELTVNSPSNVLIYGNESQRPLT